VILTILIAVLAVAQSGAGLWMQGGSGPFAFTTLHGQTVQMSGQGIYQYDTFFKAPILRGTDALTLFGCVPLLLVALELYRRGSLRGHLLLAGVLAFFVYNAASLALGVAYNNLFPLYVAYFSASLFAFILAFSSLDSQALAESIRPGLPRVGIAVLMFVSALALLFAWGSDIVGALLTGGVPDIASYTTEATYVFDLGVIAPLSVLAGILILRRAPLGYSLAAVLLVMLPIVGAMVTLQTVFQTQAGITLSVGALIGKMGSFVLLALASAGLLAAFLRRVPANLKK
jgi:hypothetical protein